jgi:hypothetical protein
VSTVKPSDAGYRGALPPRNDWLARGWVLAVVAIFIAMFVLAALNVPTILLPEPTPLPTPIATPGPSGSVDPSASAEPSASGSSAPSASSDASPSP